VKACNLDLEEAGKERKLQLQELKEIRLAAYENSKFYKEKPRSSMTKSIWLERISR